MTSLAIRTLIPQARPANPVGFGLTRLNLPGQQMWVIGVDPERRPGGAA